MVPASNSPILSTLAPLGLAPGGSWYPHLYSIYSPVLQIPSQHSFSLPPTCIRPYPVTFREATAQPLLSHPALYKLHFFGGVTPYPSLRVGSQGPTPKCSPNVSRFSAESGDFLAGVHTREPPQQWWWWCIPESPRISGGGAICARTH